MAERVVPLRPTAADAWNRIDKHEEVCAERYKNLDRGQTDLKNLLEGHITLTGTKFDSLSNAVTRFAIAIGVMGLGLIGFLLRLVIPSLHS